MAFSIDRTSRLRISVVIGALLLWSAVPAVGLASPLLMPSTSAIARAVGRIILYDGFVIDMIVTTRRVAIAVGFAAIIGIPLGLALGYRQDLYRVVEDPLHALRSIPATALFPLLLIVVGVGEASIVVLATLPCLLIVIASTALGASLANQRRVNQARRLGVSGVRLVRDVLFFEALPHVFGALRVALSYALALVVAVEMFIGIGSGGVGRRIYDYQSVYQIPETYAAILLAGALGVLFNGVLSRLEKRALAWIPNAGSSR